jgi:putative Mg2+ transporter-C (MgtC) family protein
MENLLQIGAAAGLIQTSIELISSLFKPVLTDFLTYLPAQLPSLLAAETAVYSLPPDDVINITFRLMLSLFVGAIIGLERQLQHKSAGLRTHMLVSFGSALFVLVPIELSVAGQNFDPVSRVIQGIAAGVGFIGTGEILRESQQSTRQLEVRGLTSAAAIWVSSALGVAAGCGLWQLGLIGGIFAFIVLYIMKQLEPRK